MSYALARHLAVIFAFVSTLAIAHGDEEHVAFPAYDPNRIERTDFGQQGNPSAATRTVRIDMADTMRFEPAQVSVKQGETVRFVVHNGGKLMHEMVLGTPAAIEEHAALMKRFPEMEHADANMAHVRPGADGVMVWQFTKAGEFQFACLQPGHFEAGMLGSITVVGRARR